MPVIEYRQKLAREFYRNVLWLDDEIRPESDDPVVRLPYKELFRPLADEFHKLGLFCQLKGFPSTQGADDPYFNGNDETLVCQQLAERSDILILDWHLGAADARHSTDIIRLLMAQSRARFVVILSKESALTTEFERAFPDSFKLQPDGWYKHANDLFIRLLLKQNFESPNDPKALVEAIYSQLSIAYPDYLHWTAIEISNRIKNYTPQWLSGLPGGTDLAILMERKHSTEDIREAIVENLLEDLKEHVNTSTLTLVQAPHFEFENWPLMDQLKAEWAAVRSDGQESANLYKLIPHLQDPVASPQPLGKSNTTCYTQVISQLANHPVVKKITLSVMRLGHFSEIVSVKPEAAYSIRQGSVFTNDSGDTPKSIIICISGSCDCIRKSPLIFLTGIRVAHGHSGGPGDTFICLNESHYLVESKPETQVELPIESTPRALLNYRYLGLVRQRIVLRLIARYRKQLPKVGVNQPRFLRNSRQEID